MVLLCQLQRNEIKSGGPENKTGHAINGRPPHPPLLVYPLQSHFQYVDSFAFMKPQKIIRLFSLEAFLPVKPDRKLINTTGKNKTGKTNNSLHYSFMKLFLNNLVIQLSCLTVAATCHKALTKSCNTCLFVGN